MTQLDQDSATSNNPGLAGKYLTFALSREQYGVPITRVVEIFGMKPITHVPHSPEYVKGVINLRGKIIPIIDLRAKFDMDTAQPTELTCIIVTQVKINGTPLGIGLIVDTVLEVRDFKEGDISSAPEYGAHLNTRFVTGIGKHSGSAATILMELDRIFSAEEAAALPRNNSRDDGGKSDH